MIDLLLAVPFILWLALLALIATGFAVGWKSVKWGLAAWLAFFIINFFVNPVSKPYHAIQRSSVPGFAESEAVIQDKLRKPALDEAQRQERFDSQFDAVRKAEEANKAAQK